MKKFFLVYKTINKLNDEYYIGVHITNNINDEYLGSGKRLWNSINKYGRETFKKQILAVFDNKEEMFRMEAELVTEETLKDIRCLNLKPGGRGVWPASPFSNPDWVEANKEKIKIWRQKAHENGLEAIRKMRLEGHFMGGFKGKTHTQEHKLHLSKVMAIVQAGEKNSQYGKCWIHSCVEKRSMMVKKEELQERLDSGWILGRKMKFN